jgi:putative transposase
VQASAPNQIWQSDMTKIWAGPAGGWAYLVSVIDCCTREVVGWNFSTVVEQKMRWLPWSRPY